MLHPLPDPGRGKRRRPAGRQGQDQPADPAPRRGRSALAAGGGGQCQHGLDRPCQLDRRAQDRPRHAEQCLGRAGAGGDGAAVHQGRRGAGHSADLGGAAAGGKPRAAFPHRRPQGRDRARTRRRSGGAKAGRAGLSRRNSRHSVAKWSPYDGIELPWTVAGTWRRGEQVFDGRDVLAAPGSGRFIRPRLPLALRTPVH